MKVKQVQLAADLVMSLTQLPAGLGLQVHNRRQRGRLAAGAALARLTQELGQDKIKTMGDEMLSLMVAGQIDVLSDNEYYAGVFRNHSSVQTQAGWLPLDSVFDSVFAGRYDLLDKWLVVCLEHNFGADPLGTPAPSSEPRGEKA